jgi:stage V sporulation protein B
MSHKGTLIKGTFILTATGLITRLMGFFYRIFLSHTFGEEGVGLYQLVFPIYALCFSVTSAGIQIALSRLTARYIAKGQTQDARELLRTSLLLTTALSVLVTLGLQHYARMISEIFLQDTRCLDLLILLSYAFPFASIHSCICGYYLGLKQTGVPSISQLIEQTARIGSVWLICLYGQTHGITLGISIAVAGMIFGEVAASMYSLHAILGKPGTYQFRHIPVRRYLYHLRQLITLSLPLTASRVLLNLLQSIEAVSIPLKLQVYGNSTSDALSTYGVLTGMALPLVLFPSAITNSVSTMLLPTVAEIQALDRQKELSSLIRRVTYSCIFLGSACGLGLLVLGKWLGSFLFHSSLAGNFIVTLAWICPFLYTNNTLLSVINGIGKTTLSFTINLFSLFIRICSIWLLIPNTGIYGYLWGLLGSQICVFVGCLCYLTWYMKHGL